MLCCPQKNFTVLSKIKSDFVPNKLKQQEPWIKKTNKQRKSPTVLNLSSDISVQNNLRATEKKEGRSSSACGNLAVATDVGEKKHQPNSSSNSSNSSNLQEKPPWCCLSGCQWKIGVTRKTSMNLETSKRRRIGGGGGGGKGMEWGGKGGQY